MKNKKATMELSYGTIVIIVLAMAMLILGLILVRSIFDKPEFTITKEDIETNEIEYVQYNCEVYNPILEDILNNMSNLTENKEKVRLIGNELSIPDSKVRNILEYTKLQSEFWRMEREYYECLYLGNIFNYILKKEDLSIDWLNENADCQMCQHGDDLDRNFERSKDGTAFICKEKDDICHEYKFFDYRIEVDY